MDTTEWIWHNGEWLKWDEAKVHFLTHALHYGSGAFEGIRAYKTADGPAIFRLREHLDRLFYSMSVLQIPDRFSRDDIEKAHIELLKRNKLEQGYIRPMVYYGYGPMGLSPREVPVYATIACWAWGAYLPHDMVDIKISKFIRIHPQSLVADAKISGHYSNSILASLEVRGTEYHEAVFLDYKGFVAEGPGENIFIVKNGVLRTPGTGSILKGITRDTVMRLAGKEGITVEEAEITPDEALDADEAFFTGTAAEITPIRSINQRVLGQGTVGPVTARLKSLFLDTVYGRLPETRHFLTYVR